jgi:hypothetical protein
MLTETIIASFLLGTIAGGLFVWATMFRPVDRKLHDLQYVKFREARQRLYRAELRREHLGTPYLNPPPSAVERLLADLGDNDRWSRKAPAEVISFPNGGSR